MNSITKDNYEAYVLDYMQNNISEVYCARLKLFATKHPELEIKLDESFFRIPNSNSKVIIDKTILKKTPSDLVSEQDFVDYIENQLCDADRQRVKKSILINPELKKELALYNNIIAVADTTITYPRKLALKKTPKVIWSNFQQFSILSPLAL